MRRLQIVSKEFLLLLFLDWVMKGSHHPISFYEEKFTTQKTQGAFTWVFLFGKYRNLFKEKTT